MKTLRFIFLPVWLPLALGPSVKRKQVQKFTENTGLTNSGKRRTGERARSDTGSL